MRADLRTDLPGRRTGGPTRAWEPVRPSRPREPVRPSRPRAAIAALLALALTALAGCSGAGDSAGTGGAPAGQPTAGGEAVFAIDTPLTSFDPNVAAAAQDARVMRQIYDSLVTLDDDREPVGWLAESFEVSEDQKTYTFEIRDGVTFHDGAPLDAEAVCFNFDRIVDPESASIYAVTLVGPYDSCAAVDDSTAEITLSTPYAPFIYNLSSPFLGMVSPKSAEEMPLADFALHPVGTGPFRFESYTANDRIVLTRNPDYDWAPPTAGHSGPAQLDQLTFQIIPDATVRVGSLRNGSVQAVGNVPETEAAAIQQDPTLEFVAQPQSGSPYQLNFNTARKPFDDPDLRRAIRMAMDIDSAVQALYFGVYDRAWGPLSPTTTGYDAALQGSFDYDPEGAKAALDQLGWKTGPDGIREKDGERLEVSYIEGVPNREKRQDVAQFLKKNLEDVGVAVEVRLLQSAPGTTNLQEGDYDLRGLSLVSVDPNVLYSLYSPDFIPEPGRTGFNFTQIDDPALARSILAAQRSGDPDERTELYAEVQREVVDQAISVGVYVPTYTVASKGLSGLRFDAEGYPVLYDTFRAESD